MEQELNSIVMYGKETLSITKAQRRTSFIRASIMILTKNMVSKAYLNTLISFTIAILKIATEPLSAR